LPTLILGVHNHQPVGNFDSVIRDAQERAYDPFLERLERHRSLKVCLHVSGPLLEWQKIHAPEYLERLAALVDANRVELLGGGYWEPILSVLPERDQHAQVERMCGELETRFGRRPRGLWLAERIWEPHLPALLSEHGLDYVALDDSHFLAAGFAPEALRGYYLTEEEGKSLAVFPISKTLRYLVPFHPVEKVAEHLGSLGDGLGVLMDDGEKFGVWSSTHELCYGKEDYLDRLFAMLGEVSDLKLCGFSEYMDGHAPIGLAYLPTASYVEMGEWALPREAQGRYERLAALVLEDHPELAPHLRGGFWRNFFVKYEESNWIHKRNLWLGEKLAELRQAGADPEMLAEAEDLRLQAQCNCGYWHGLFGGLYLPHLRQALCERMVRAEALALPPGYGLERRDIDLDGEEELIWSSPALRLFLRPGAGGRVQELDFLPRAFPLTNTLTRRSEHYHAKLAELEAPADEGAGAKSIHEIVTAKEEGLARFLVADPHARASLEERLYPAGAETCGYSDESLDFSGVRFAAEAPDGPAGPLRLSGTLSLGEGRSLTLDKELVWTDDGRGLGIELRLAYAGSGRLKGLFASGWNFNFLAPDAPDRYILVDGRPAAEPILRSRGWERGLRRIEIRDEYSGVAVALAGEGLSVYREPIETVSLSEAGFERVYQGSWFAVGKPVALESGEAATLCYDLTLLALPGNDS
jgi:hypothetical protein